MNDDQIKYMADRFLTYELPEDFAPDGGISFERYRNAGTPYEWENRPVGTNILTSSQAEEMVRYLVKNLPA